MESVTVCSGCKKIIESAFLFCPWCGVQRVAPILADKIFTESCLQLERKVAAGQTLQQRIDRLESQIDRLSDDLQCIQPSVLQGEIPQ